MTELLGDSTPAALRRWVPALWIAATSVGMAVGLTAGAALVDYGISRGDIVVMGAVTGVGVGALQALVLARLGIRVLLARLFRDMEPEPA